MSGPKWFAVHTAAGKEALANYWLERRGFETYWPSELIDRKVKLDAEGKEIRSSKTLLELVDRRPSISRYLFVKTVPERFGHVNETLGVSTVVFAPGGNPFPIASAVILRLRSALAAQRARRPAPGKFGGAIGDLVKGREGWPHWGLMARILEICGETVTVEMVMLGSRSRPVKVPARSLDVVDEFNN